MEAKEYARIAGITPERVRQLARAHRIDAELIEGRWQIEYDGSPHRSPSRRPLSQQSRKDMLRFFVTMKLDHVTGVAKQRLAQRYRELMSAPSRAQLLLEWWGWEQPEGTFAERNFIRAAQQGDEEWLAAMLEYPDAWLLSDGPTIAARLGDRMALNGLKAEDLAERSGLAVETVRRIVRYGEGSQFVPKLRTLKAAGLSYSEVLDG